MPAAVPQIGRRAAGMARHRDGLEVRIRTVTLGEGAAHPDMLLRLLPVVLVTEERHLLPDEKIGLREHRLVPVAEIMPCDAAQLLDGTGLIAHRGGAMEEEIAGGPLQDEGADLERLIERQ